MNIHSWRVGGGDLLDGQIRSETNILAVNWNVVTKRSRMIGWFLRGLYLIEQYDRLVYDRATRLVL